jgi:alpha-tubulin suppressor-like RCC1 family protein
MTNWSTQPGHLSSVNSKTFAIKKDGTLWAWGQNSNGQLGLMDTTNKSSPTQLGNDYWRWVTAGQFSLAIKTDGSLWGWGYNYAGILKSTNINGFISSPVQIGSDNNWATVITGGSYNALATKLDGTLWAVGYNGNGQLGLNDTVDRSNFTQIGTSTWSVASIGSVHSLAIDTYGRLYSWGYNAKGSLGLGDTLDRSSPTQVGSLTSWKFAKAGSNLNSIAITSNGHLYAWGLNQLGQTGLYIVDTSGTSSPTQVGSAPFRWANLSSQSNGSEFAILSPVDPPY